MLRDSPDISNCHDKKQMINYAMAALRAIKYDKRITGITMFEDMDD